MQQQEQEIKLRAEAAEAQALAVRPVRDRPHVGPAIHLLLPLIDHGVSKFQASWLQIQKACIPASGQAHASTHVQGPFAEPGRLLALV
eukprot:1149744-Pelagomonas_calceolata.AAC.5